jgi:hypothetical protein
VALRRRLKVEDALIVSFAVVWMLYPFLIALLIHHQESAGVPEEVSRLREVYSVILGLVACERSEEVTDLMDPALLEGIGGEEGLRRICEENRRLTYGRPKVLERITKEGNRITLRARVSFKERGVVRRSVTVVLRARTGERGPVVEDIVYVQGD